MVWGNGPLGEAEAYANLSATATSTWRSHSCSAPTSARRRGAAEHAETSAWANSAALRAPTHAYYHTLGRKAGEQMPVPQRLSAHVAPMQATRHLPPGQHKRTQNTPIMRSTSRTPGLSGEQASHRSIPASMRDAPPTTVLQPCAAEACDFGDAWRWFVDQECGWSALSGNLLRGRAGESG